MRWWDASPVPLRGSATAGTLPPLIVVAGATATGKTGLSLALADVLERDGGPGAEIISADSRQVHRGMDIGTAKVGAADRARVPHHGLDLVDPDEGFTAADFRDHALTALRAIAGRGRIAILAGGTGLYLRIMGRGIPVEAAGHDATLRAALETRLALEGSPALVAELVATAPGIAARTDLANPRRVVRALERARLMGDRPPPTPIGYAAPVLWLGTRLERPVHDRLILERARSQFEAGLLEEARALRERFGEDLRSFSAMGYQEAFGVLDGAWDLETAVERDVARTRRYARRQETWFRSEPDITWLDGTRSDALAVPIVERWLSPPDRPGTAGGP